MDWTLRGIDILAGNPAFSCSISRVIFRLFSLLLLTAAMPWVAVADIKLPPGAVPPPPSTPSVASGPAAVMPAPAAAAPVSTEPPVEIRRAIAVDEKAPVVVAAPVTKIVYTRCAVPAPVIAITFDDGPNPDHTPRLLDMLKARNG